MNELKILAGFIFGVGVGFLVSKRFFEEKYKQIADEEIASVRANMGRRGHILERTSIDDPEIVKKDPRKELNMVRNPSVNSEIKLYSSIDNMYDTTKKVHVSPVESDPAEAEHPEDDRAEDVYVISEEDFSETELGYDKITLHYYTDDDMIVDADSGDWSSNLNSDIEQMIRDSKKEELYFRDDASGTDFEVLRIKGAYYIDV